MEHIIVDKSFKSDKLLTSQRHINVSAPLHVNIEMEFVIVTDGKVIMQIGNEKYTINAGFACFIMPFEPHSFHTDIYSKCHVLMFSSNIINDFFRFLVSNNSDTKRFEISSEVIAITDKILPFEKNSADIIDALACVAPICAEIKHNCVFTKGIRLYDDVFFQALSIANENFATQITVEEVAKKIGINAATLGRIFACNAKVSFTTYINSLRCHYAAVRMLETDDSFTEIAYSSGFGSIRNFNRVFLKHMNQTPSEFKKNPCEINGNIHI